MTRQAWPLFVVGIGVLGLLAPTAIGQVPEPQVTIEFAVTPAGYPLPPLGPPGTASVEVAATCQPPAVFRDVVTATLMAENVPSWLSLIIAPNELMFSFQPQDCLVTPVTYTHAVAISMAVSDRAPAFERLPVRLAADVGAHGGPFETTWDEEVGFGGRFEASLDEASSQWQGGDLRIPGAFINLANGPIRVHPTAVAGELPRNGTLDLPDSWDVPSPLEEGSDGRLAFHLLYEGRKGVSDRFTLQFEASSRDRLALQLEPVVIAFTVSEAGEVTAIEESPPSRITPPASVLLHLVGAACAALMWSGHRQGRAGSIPRP